MSTAPLLYGEVLSFVAKAVFLEDFLFGSSDRPVLPSLQELVRRSKERWGLQPDADRRGQPAYEIKFANTSMACSSARLWLHWRELGFSLNSSSGRWRSTILPRIARALPASSTCWSRRDGFHWKTARDKSSVSLTACGRYAAQIATSYGVTVSYLPLFDNVSTLLFGNSRIPRMDESGVELLVNRGMNVWGSGGAHRTYFKKVDEIIVEIFNRPLHPQPRGICDMGCGDGTFP